MGRGYLLPGRQGVKGSVINSPSVVRGGAAAEKGKRFQCFLSVTEHLPLPISQVFKAMKNIIIRPIVTFITPKRQQTLTAAQ